MKKNKIILCIILTNGLQELYTISEIELSSLREENENGNKICKDFTDAPGPRFKSQGDFSGEAFREEFLVPKFKEALEKRKNQ